MLVLLFGVAAIVSTIVLGAYGSDSWLYCWEGVGDTQVSPAEEIQEMEVSIP